jgi:hypothetical protein
MIWLALDLVPFSIVSNRGFHYFFGKNIPTVSVTLSRVPEVGWRARRRCSLFCACVVKR